MFNYVQNQLNDDPPPASIKCTIRKPVFIESHQRGGGIISIGQIFLGNGFSGVVRHVVFPTKILVVICGREKSSYGDTD
jgi:hypothetical protein